MVRWGERFPESLAGSTCYGSCQDQKGKKHQPSRSPETSTEHQHSGPHPHPSNLSFKGLEEVLRGAPSPKRDQQ